MLHERRYLIPFRATLLPQIFTDVLVIGAGVAGARAALEAGRYGDVIIACKGQVKHSATYWAQGGISAVIREDDSIESHVSDTMVAGAELCDEPVVRDVVAGGPGAIEDLIEMGMRMDRAAASGKGDDEAFGLQDLALGREGGHSHFRVVHSDGDATGRALALTLYRRAQEHEKIRLFDGCFVLDLITSDTDPAQCLGAITHHPKYGLQVIWARATILAAGGAGMVYRETTNPNAATGDGIAMAWRAGAELADLAFVQFHPTTLYVAGSTRSLITEAVRGEGATLIDKHGYRFMPEYDERAELAPRDIVSRSILHQVARTGTSHVFLDARNVKNFTERFPGITEVLRQFEIDPAKDPIPVQPAAHYTIGGVRTDAEGQTSLAGLFAVGEAACSGLHGANRLASNSLLEGMVLGKRAAIAAEKLMAEGPITPHRIISDIPLTDRAELDLNDVRSSLRSVMWRHVGIERDGDRLEEVREMIGFWSRYTLDKIFDERLGWEVQNLLTVGGLITRAAAWREESRGTHYRTDMLETRDAFHVHDLWKRRRKTPETAPVAAADLATP